MLQTVQNMVFPPFLCHHLLSFLSISSSLLFLPPVTACFLPLFLTSVSEVMAGCLDKRWFPLLPSAISAGQWCSETWNRKHTECAFWSTSPLPGSKAWIRKYILHVFCYSPLAIISSGQLMWWRVIGKNASDMDTSLSPHLQQQNWLEVESMNSLCGRTGLPWCSGPAQPTPSLEGFFFLLPCSCHHHLFILGVPTERNGTFSSPSQFWGLASMSPATQHQVTTEIKYVLGSLL